MSLISHWDIQGMMLKRKESFCFSSSSSSSGYLTLSKIQTLILILFWKKRNICFLDINEWMLLFKRGREREKISKFQNYLFTVSLCHAMCVCVMSFIHLEDCKDSFCVCFCLLVCLFLPCSFFQIKILWWWFLFGKKI